MCSGALLPATVRLVTPRVANACRRAWHYTELCRRAGIGSRGTYLRWMQDKQLLPDAWRPRLFGEDEPAGAFVVELPLQRLRQEMSPAGILKAAGVVKETLRLWKKDPTIRNALSWAVDWAARTGAPENLNPPWPEAAHRLPARGGKGCHRSTLLRWISRGAKAPDGSMVRVEANRLGGRWMTSREAFQRFAERLTPELGQAEGAARAAKVPRAPAARERASRRAERELAKVGI